MVDSDSREQRAFDGARELQVDACEAAMLGRIHYRHGDFALARGKAFEAETLYRRARTWTAPTRIA